VRSRDAYFRTTKLFLQEGRSRPKRNHTQFKKEAEARTHTFITRRKKEKPKTCREGIRGKKKSKERDGDRQIRRMGSGTFKIVLVVGGSHHLGK